MRSCRACRCVLVATVVCVAALAAWAVRAQEVWNRPDNATSVAVRRFMAHHDLTNCYYRLQWPYGFLKCRLANRRVYTFQVLVEGDYARLRPGRAVAL